VVVHSRRLRRRSGFGGLAALLTVATDGPQGVLTETLGMRSPSSARAMMLRASAAQTTRSPRARRKGR
jgi:hypothetical protein